MAARNKGTHFVITANRTQDGACVYLRSDHTWSENIGEARVVETETDQEALIGFAKTQERVVCDPYAFSVNVRDGIPVLLTQRETIRSSGPTVSYRRPDRAPQVAKEA